MIIVLCNDDPALSAAAADQAGGVYGNFYQFIQQGTPQLGAVEPLFISAHGIQGEIGNEDGALGYSAVELWNYLTNQTPNDRGGSLFPAGYWGDFYFSCCYAANVTRRDRLSFVENFHALSRVTPDHSNVYGQYGAVGYPIPAPGAASWQQVANV